jgi:hypothetical protein
MLIIWPVLISCKEPQQTSFVEQWNRNPNMVIEKLEDFNSERKTLAILSLVETYPKSSLQLCQMLEKGQAKKRCENLMRRPHLWTKNPSKVNNSRGSIGPRSRHLHPEIKDDRLYNHAKKLPLCTNEISILECVEKQTMENRTPVVIASMCNALTLGWREECYFTTAEHHVREDGIQAYEQSVQYCLHSGSFQSNCFQHLIFQLAQHNIADPTDIESWDSSIKTAEYLSQFWQTKDKAFGYAMVDLFWAKQTDLSVLVSGSLCTNPIDFLPKEAINHYRDAYVYFSLLTEEQNLSLFEVTKKLSKPQCTTVSPFPFQRKKHQQNWSDDNNQNHHYPAQYYLTDGRRIVGQTVNEDWELSIVEANARLPKQAVIKTPITSSHKTVIWTIKRLNGGKL